MTNDNDSPERKLKLHNDLVDRLLELSADVPSHLLSCALLDTLAHTYVTATAGDPHQIAQLKRLGDMTLDAFLGVATMAYAATGRAR